MRTTLTITCDQQNYETGLSYASSYVQIIVSSSANFVFLLLFSPIGWPGIVILPTTRAACP
jgi:hypothetical protein